MDLIANLQKIGLTRHEAVLYITLCKEGELTGYEAAKLTGIPRSNAYLALAGLVEKGAAYRIESEAAKYTAVPAVEFTRNMRRELERVLDYIEENIPAKDERFYPFITINGSRQIVHKMKNIIEQARERIYLSCSPAELEHVRNELAQAAERKLKVVLITAEPLEHKGFQIYIAPKQPGQIRLIADSSHVLTGEFKNSGDCSCLYSQNENLVNLIKDSLTNEIKLIELGKSGGNGALS